jgi:hypothetical protein
MASDALTVPADGASAVQRVGAFVTWVGAGRPLTQTGRLRRADALSLADLAGDVIDPRHPLRGSGDLRS